MSEISNINVGGTSYSLKDNTARENIVLETQNTKDWAKGTFSNPNLLINGDFQVWQRGTNISLSNNGYTADRWHMWSSKSTIFTKANEYGGIKFTGNGNNNFGYIFEKSTMTKENNVYSISIKAKSSKPGSCTVTLRDVENASGGGTALWGETININENYQIFKCTSSAVSAENYLKFSMSLYGAFDEAEIEIAWIKIELGEVATPFVPKVYADELAACQRYYLSMPKFTEFRLTNLSDNTVDFSIPLPVAMRITPTLVGADNIGMVIVSIPEHANQTGFTLSTTYSNADKGYCLFRGTKENHGLSDALIIVMSSSVFLDAEIK